MKHITLFFALLLCAAAHGQTQLTYNPGIYVNGVNINEHCHVINVGVYGIAVYVEHAGLSKEEMRTKNKLQQEVTDADGNKVEAADENELRVLDFFERNGWEYLGAVPPDGLPGAVKYRFRKKT